MKTQRVIGVLLLALVLSADFGDVAEARHVAKRHKAASHGKRHMLRKHEEQPVISATVVVSVVTLVASSVTIVAKVTELVRNANEDRDYEEDTGNSMHAELVQQLSLLKTLANSVDPSAPIVFVDGQYMMSVKNEGAVLDIINDVREISLKNSISEDAESVPLPSSKKGKKIDLSLYEGPISGDVTREISSSSMEEEPVVTGVLATAAAVTSVIAGVITIADGIAKIVNPPPRRRRGRRLEEDEEDEEVGNSVSHETLMASMNNPKQFWSLLSSPISRTVVKRETVNAKKVRKMLVVLCDGLSRLEPTKLENKNGEWYIPMSK